MSASDANSAIYVTDSAKEIKTKVNPELLLLAGKNITNQLHVLVNPFIFWRICRSE